MQDPADSVYWAKTFPGQNSAPWKEFLPIFKKDVEKSPPPHPFLTLDVIMAVAFDVGFPERDDAVVTADMLAIFIKRFGPLRLCVTKVVENLFSPATGELLPWFHGAVSRQEAEQCLRRNLSPGRYLVRFSEAKPDKFTLVLVNGELKILNVLISNLGDHGYGLKPDYASCSPGDHFGSIPEFIHRQKDTLSQPEPSPLYDRFLCEMRERQRRAAEHSAAVEASAHSALRIAAQPEPEDPYGVFDPVSAYPAYPTFHTPPAAPALATQKSFPLTPPASAAAAAAVPMDDYASFESVSTDFSAAAAAAACRPLPAVTPVKAAADDSVKFAVGSLIDQATHFVSSAGAEGATEALASLTEALRLLLPLLHTAPATSAEHPLFKDDMASDIWNSPELHSVWVFNCGGMLLLHSGLGSMHRKSAAGSGVTGNTLGPLYSSEMSWDNDAAGSVCFPPPSHRATEMLSVEAGRWKEQTLARILTARGAAMAASDAAADALAMYEKAIWVYCTLYAEQDLADVSANDADLVHSLLLSPESSPSVHALSPSAVRRGCAETQVTHSLCSALREAASLAGKVATPLCALRYYEEVLARACALGDWKMREFVSVSLIQAHHAAVQHVAPHEYEITSDNAKRFLDEGKKEYVQGKAVVAESLLRVSLTCARLCGDQEIELKSLCNLATVLKETKKLVEASDLYRQCIALCKLFKKKYNVVEKQAMYEMAKCLIDSGLPSRGLAVLDRAITLAESRRNIETLRELKEKTQMRLLAEGGGGKV